MNPPAPELLPCPFCGDENVIEGYTSQQPFKIQCECVVGPMVTGKSLQECIYPHLGTINAPFPLY